MAASKNKKCAMHCGWQCSFKRSASIVDKLNLKYIVLIFDEALYSKAQHIQWKSEEFLSKFIIRLGDFHTCMSFASAIACRFREAGLQVPY